MTDRFPPLDVVRRSSRLATVDLVLGAILVAAAAALLVAGQLEVRATIARDGHNIDSGVYHAMVAWYIGPIGVFLLAAAASLRRRRAWARAAHAGALTWAIVPVTLFALACSGAPIASPRLSFHRLPPNIELNPTKGLWTAAATRPRHT
jgi:hypothetical protein